MSKNAWLTPDASILANPQDCRKISVPGDLFYLVTGCLELLAESDNWEGFGTATPDEMAQYFRDVLDDYSVSGCGMKWLDVPVSLFSETVDWNSGYTITVLNSQLPSEIQNATAVFCRVISRVNNQSHVIFHAKNPLTGLSYDAFRMPVQNIDQYNSVIFPVKDGVSFTMDAATGQTVFWAVSIRGWWE